MLYTSYKTTLNRTQGVQMLKTSYKASPCCRPPHQGVPILYTSHKTSKCCGPHTRRPHVVDLPNRASRCCTPDTRRPNVEPHTKCPSVEYPTKGVPNCIEPNTRRICFFFFFLRGYLNASRRKQSFTQSCNNFTGTVIKTRHTEK